MRGAGNGQPSATARGWAPPSMSGLVIALPGGSLDLLEGRILRHGQVVKIEPRAWRVLEQLARFSHRVVTKDELLAALRPEGSASEGALRQAIRAARVAIGDDADDPIIRSIPRVGYIFDVSRAATGAAAAARVPGTAAPGLLVGPLRNDTGQHRLHWTEHGLAACIALSLMLDGRVQLRDAQSLDLSQVRERQDIRKMLQAFGARYAVFGAIRAADAGVELTLQVHTEDGETELSIRAATAADLVVPAVESLHQRLFGHAGGHAGVDGLRGRSALAIELFARAKQLAADHKNAAALRGLELLHSIEPSFPRLDLELLNLQARCGDEKGEASAARLLTRAQREQDTILEAQTRQSLATLQVARGQLRAAALSFQQSLLLGRACMAPDWQAHTLTLLAAIECRLGEMRAAQAHLDEAQANLRRIGNHYGQLNVMWVRAVMSALSGKVEQAIQWNKKLAATARRFHADIVLVGACLNLAFDLIHADRLDEAREYAEEASATAWAIEIGSDLVRMIANIQCLYYRVHGSPLGASAVLARLPHPAELQDEGYLWQAHGHAAMAADRPADAAEFFLQAAAECRGRGNLVADAALLPWLVEALVRSGRLRTAQAELERASAQPHLQDEPAAANLLYARALLARSRGQHKEAAELLARLAQSHSALPLFRRLGRELSSAPHEPNAPPPRQALPPSGIPPAKYRFGHCVLDIERRELWVEGQHRALAPRPFGVLVHLYRNRHRVVSQEELLDNLWDDASGSPESVAQAIAKIRQAVRSGVDSAGLIQTVYGKGYRLVIDASDERHDESGASLLSDSPVPREPALAFVPLPAPDGQTDGCDPSIAYQLELLGYAMATHSRMRRLPRSEIREALWGLDGSTPSAMAAAIRGRCEGASVLVASLSQHDRMLALEYHFESAGLRAAGGLQGPSATELGKRLADRLLRQHDAEQPERRCADPHGWVTRMLDLATLATEHRRWGAAIRILDVILDNEPDNELAVSLREHLGREEARHDEAPASAPAGRHDAPAPVPAPVPVPAPAAGRVLAG